MTLDIKTIVIITLIVNLVNVGIMAIIWNQYKNIFKGLKFLLADMFLQLVGVLLLAQRGVIPDSVSMVVGNSLLIIGTYFILRGLEHFLTPPKETVITIGSSQCFLFS